MARDHARGLVAAGSERLFRGPTGIPFSANVVGPADGAVPGAVTVRVSGTSAFAGHATFMIEADDPLAHGFTLPRSYGELA